MRREPIQERQHRARRARTEIRAEHGVEPESALEQRRLEVLLEQVVHVHPADAQELAHVVAAESADLPAESRERRVVLPVGGAEARRYAGEHRHQRLARSAAFVRL